MSTTAPRLFLILICASIICGVTTSALSPPPPPPVQKAFESIVPWRGIRNTIFPAPDSAYNRMMPPEDGFCFVMEPNLDFSNVPFRTSTRSIPNANIALGASLWNSERTGAGRRLRDQSYVRRVDGAAELLTSTNKTKLKVGQRVPAGTVLKTQSSSQIDLFLGDNGPVLRVHENSELELTRLNLESTHLEKIIDTRLHLRAGRISGFVRKLASESTYLIRTRTNLIRIRGTEYEIGADGSCAIISGFAEVITPTQIITVNTGEKYDPTQTASQNK